MIIIVSDLHVGAGPLDDFDDEIEKHFFRFLEQFTQHDGACELVINGDFLDFVQAPPWTGEELRSRSANGTDLCFTEDQSVTKLNAIAKSHGDLFERLGRFVGARDNHSIVIVPGNHDPDFFWKRVRLRFAELCGLTAATTRRLRFHLEQVYRPASFPGASVEHGHQYDFVNWFRVGKNPYWSAKRPPILADKTGVPRLLECVGTRFLNRFINPLEEAYPYVDNVKPFGRFLEIFGASVFVPGYGPLKALVAVWSMLKYLATTLAEKPSDLLQLSKQLLPSRLLLESVNAMTLDQRRSFADELGKHGFSVNQPLPMLVANESSADELLTFLADHLSLVDALEDEASTDLSLSSRSGDELSLLKTFRIDETAKLTKAARTSLSRKDTTAVIMGHTHEVVRPREQLPYANTGCWTRYYRFGDDEPTPRWKLLRSPSYQLFPYELNYVQILPGDSRPIRFECFAERKK